MEDESAPDPLWRRGAEAIAEARRLLELREEYLRHAEELATRRLLSANASLAYAHKATNIQAHIRLIAAAADKGRDGPEEPPAAM